jgi:cytochrome c biogenesis protein CcmG, thiol:disulfide interchange protein DsbE
VTGVPAALADEARPGPPPQRRPRNARRAAVAVGLVVVALVAVLATRPNAGDIVAASPLRGQPAPEIQGPDLDGTVTRLSDFRGRWVVVNFFATWCVPCLKEHPELIRFSERHAPAEVQVVAVVYDDDPGDVRSFFSERGGDWPVIDSSRAKVDFGVLGVPESFLITPGGIVVDRIVGGVTADGLDRFLRQAQAALG